MFYEIYKQGNNEEECNNIGKVDGWRQIVHSNSGNCRKREKEVFPQLDRENGAKQIKKRAWYSHKVYIITEV